ncbi:MAG: CHAP domain-containing protein [Candidatus Saccharimonadales bacterium]
MKKNIRFQLVTKGKPTPSKRRVFVGAVFVLVALVTAGMNVVPRIMPQASADANSEIQRLQAENAVNNNVVAQLKDQAVSYKDAIARLQSQINSVQGQINVNTADQNRIRANIVANEQELVRQRSILGENIRVSYVDGKISTIEMLATSKNLSDFVDKEEYRTTIKNKIQTTLVQINDIQNQLKEDNVRVSKLLEEQQQQRAVLASARSEQSSMLSYNQAQQGSYNQKTKDNQARIAALIAAQRRANNSTDGGYYFLRFDGPIKDFNPEAYPYKNAGFSMSTAPGCVDDDGPDRWGYCTRQCVSFAAWAVEASGRSAPMYYGNAKDWVGKAYARGVEVSRAPQPGDIAISTSGTWGHAMYVEKVESNRIYVAQYNANLDGRFSYQWRNY